MSRKIKCSMPYLITEKEAKKIPQDIRKYDKPWWLNNAQKDRVRLVSKDGKTGVACYKPGYPNAAVRPAVKHEEETIKTGDEVILDTCGEPRKWIAINDTTLLYNDECKTKCFDFDGHNNYDDAEIKKFVESRFVVDRPLAEKGQKVAINSGAGLHNVLQTDAQAMDMNQHNKKQIRKSTWVKISGAIVLATILCISVIIAENPCPYFGHNLVSHKAKAATCTEDGWKAYDTCSRCEYSTYTTISATGHEWGKWEILKKPSYDDDGEKARTCNVCGEKDYQYISKIEKPLSMQLPYIGMSGDDIDKTKLGVHTRVEHNTRNIAKSSGVFSVEHDCTIYLWYQGSSCVFLARVDDVENEVVNIEDHPAGIYYGN